MIGYNMPMRNIAAASTLVAANGMIATSVNTIAGMMPNVVIFGYRRGAITNSENTTMKATNAIGNAGSPSERLASRNTAATLRNAKYTVGRPGTSAFSSELAAVGAAAGAVAMSPLRA